MNKLLALSSALLLLAATAATPVSAHQHNGGSNGKHQDKHHSDGNNQGGHGDRYNDDRRYYAKAHYHPKTVYVYPRGYRASRWYVGARLPVAFYAAPYYVDYRPYRLAPPPRGHRWVRVDNDVYLVATNSGLVVDISFGLFN